MKEQHKAPGKCPVCGEKLSITRLKCPNCTTTIEGDFVPCEFCRLPKDELDFIKVFIKCRDNIKDVEKELGISYPTVRSKLDGVIRSLGYEVENKEEIEEKRKAKEEAKSDVLDKLSKGEISAKDAAEMIKKL